MGDRLARGGVSGLGVGAVGLVVSLVLCSACAKHVEFEREGSRVHVASHDLRRQITIASPLGKSVVMLAAPQGYTMFDAVYICFEAGGRVEVVNPRTKVKTVSLAEGHRFRVDLPVDSSGIPDASRHQASPCFSFDFETESVYPASAEVEVRKWTTVGSPF